jgi:hypothetical protein
MVHLDWHTSIHDGKKVFVCVVLDDSSRRILAGGEFDEETTENNLWLLREAMDKFGWLTSITSKLASSILRPMENWKNGTTLMNVTGLCSRILTIS